MKMRRTFLLLSFGALFTASASSAFAQKGKPAPSPTPAPCPADVTALQVVFADGPDDLYRSDNGQAYVTTKSRRETIDIRLQQANCSYDLTMNLNSSARTTRLTLGVGGETRNSEFFNFDRVSSVPVTQDRLNPDGTVAEHFLQSQFCLNYYAIDPATGRPAHNPDGTVQDNYAGCGQDKDAEGNPIPGRYYVRRSVGIQAGDTSQGFRYQYSTIDNIATWAAGTSFIRVYRPSADVWELSPEVAPGGPENAPGLWGRLHNNNTNTDLGDFSVPFRITVTRLNLN